LPSKSSAEYELNGYESLPENPFILVKKERPKSCLLGTRKYDHSREYIPPTSMKTQTVRTNLEKYQIEKVFSIDETTLRRVRYLIESKHAQKSHLSILSVLEYSSIPSVVIQSVFGIETKTLFAVKVLLCRAIEANNSIINEVRSTKQRPISAFSRVTTPQPLLEILEKVDPIKKKTKKISWKQFDSIVMHNSRKSIDEVDRRELLGSILLGKKLGISA
jgi:hypothetical protein